MVAISRRAALASALAAAAAPPPAWGAEAPGTHAQRLRAKCAALVRSDDLSGAVLLMKDGRVLMREAFGLRDRAERLVNRTDTKFNIASMGKLFTSLAIMRFVQAGNLVLDRPLIEAWPDYPNRAVAERITIAQVLTHTAGLGNHVMFKPHAGLDATARHTDYLRLFANEPLEGEPGGPPSYSNDGYILLGALIERLTGADFRDHCRETIFAPLGMANTLFGAPGDIIPNSARPYVRDLARPGVWRDASIGESLPSSAAGGALSTLDDMARFLEAMRTSTLLRPEMARAWTQMRTTSRRGGYGYGVEIETINGQRVIGHSGGHYGIAGEAMLFEQSGYVAIALTNGEVEPFWDLANFIRVEIAGEYDRARDYAFTRQVIDTVSASGVEAGLALVAQNPERSAREGVIDVYGFRAWHRGEAQAGEALLRFNTRRVPESPSALWSMAEFYRYARRPVEAIAAYEAYLAQAPGDADALAAIVNLRA